MKNKKFLLIIGIFSPVLIILYFKYISGWMSFRENTDTPAAFLNQILASKENYTRDSTEIISQLKKSLLKHEKFFQSKEYDDTTRLIIDSMVYSPDFKKIAILVITQNAVSKQMAPDRRYDWYYDATCFLGMREGDSIRIKWMGPVFTNSYNKARLSDILREASFRTFAIDDSLYRYNLNDTRFWNTPIWGKKFQ